MNGQPLDSSGQDGRESNHERSSPPPRLSSGSLEPGGFTPFRLGKIGQIAVVVHDLDRALQRYWSVLGIGPWSVYTYGTPTTP